jgi:hypothetical protein
MCDPVRLAEAMADRIQPLLPGSLRATPNGERVELGNPRTWAIFDCGVFLAMDPGGVEEPLLFAAERFLDRVQDFVSEELTMPWPARPDQAHQSQLPRRWVEIRGAALRLGFGDASSPMVELEPIPLEAIRS